MATILSAALAVAPSTLESQVFCHVEVVEQGAGLGPPVGDYLRERVLAAWPDVAQQRDVDTEGETRVPADALHLVVVLVHHDSSHFTVSIYEGGELWAQRLFATKSSDATATRLAAWLFVRSTVARERAMLPRTNREDASDGVDEVKTPTVVSRMPAASVSDAAGDLPLADVRAAVLATAATDSRGLWAVGVSTSVDSLFANRSVVWGELGYAYSQSDNGLRLHRVPLSVGVGIRPAALPVFDVGMSAVTELKVARAGDSRRLVLGMAVGPAIRAAVFAPTLPLVVRLGCAWNLMRQRYVLDEGTVVEGVASMSLAAGVRWR